MFECPPEDPGLRTVCKHKKAALLQCLSDSFKIKQVIYLIKTARLSSNLHTGFLAFCPPYSSSVSCCGWFPRSLDTYWAPALLGIPHTKVFGNEHWEGECVHTVPNTDHLLKTPFLKEINYVANAFRGQKVLDTLEVKLQILMNYLVGAGNWF